MKLITRHWYNADVKPPALLSALSRLYGQVIYKKRLHYSQNQQNLYRPPVPIIVIGNITVGGTGKTPLVIAIAHFLLNKGYKVGIISRGYKGKSKRWPLEVNKSSSAEIVGDEPLLIAQTVNVPVFVGPKRNDDIRALLKQYPDINVILSDDGMQHYSMHRDIEIAVIDGDRLFGNKCLLPAGPLREPLSRLESVDFKVFNSTNKAGDIENKTDNDYLMQLQLGIVYKLQDKSNIKPLLDFSGKRVHAVAGIGNPDRFFNALKDLGLQLIKHAYADHFQYSENDLNYNEKLPILITEKDAVKCAKFNLPDCWVVTVQAELDEKFYSSLMSRLKILGKNNG